jgi:hypothetical protein
MRGARGPIPVGAGFIDSPGLRRKFRLKAAGFRARTPPGRPKSAAGWHQNLFLDALLLQGGYARWAKAPERQCGLTEIRSAETPGLRISRSEGAIDARISHRRSCGLGRPPEFTAKIRIVNFDLCSTTLTGEVRMVAQPADGLLILMATAKARNANTGVLE